LLVVFHHRQPQHLREVQSAPPGRLGDLLAAAEAVGDDQGVGRRLAHRRQQRKLGAAHRHFVALAALEAESPGHPAAAGLEHPGVDAEAVQQILGAADGAGVVGSAAAARPPAVHRRHRARVAMRLHQGPQRLAAPPR